MKRTWMLVMTVLLAGLAGLAQEPMTYDLPAAVARALEANPALRAARQSVTTAEAKVDEARAAGRVKVQGEAGYLQLADDPSFTVVPMGTLVFGKTDNPWANVSLDYPIYSGGLIQGMIAATRQGVDAAWQGYARTRQETVAEVSTAYYQALSAEQMVEVMRQQVATLKEAVRVSTGLHDQGMVAKLDVLRPTSELASAEAMLTQTENGRQLALINLKRLLNLSREAEIHLAPTVEPSMAPAELGTAVEQAYAQRPEVKQLQAYQRATEAQLTMAQAGRKPQLGLHAQYDLERATTYPDIGAWSVAVVLRQSLYDGGSAQAKQDQATSRQAELRNQEEALRQGITMQVTNALLTLRASEQKLAATRIARTTAEEAYNAALMSYRNQVVPMIDVLDAQTALTQARVQVALAEFEQQTAWVQYHLALGTAPEGE